MRAATHNLLVLAPVVLVALFLGFAFEATAHQPTQSIQTPTGGEVFYVSADHDDGLIAFWRFDEESGSTAVDVSGSGAHGTLSGDAAFSDAALPDIGFQNTRALVLDGSGDYVDATDMDAGDDLTISLWAKPDQTSGKRTLVAKHTAGGTNLVILSIKDGYYFVRVRGDSFSTPNGAGTDWQHLALTLEKTGNSSTLARVYISGIEAYSQTLTTALGDLSGLPWTIGQDWDGGSRTDFFDGSLDDIRIYNRRLSPLEVNQLANGTDHDGSSWDDAYSTLERALGVADSNDQIWVAQGLYKPSHRLDGDEPRTATFWLHPGPKILGGFEGDEATLEERDWQTHRTVLSGDIDNNDVTDSHGVVKTPANINGGNALHVLYGTSLALGSVVLDGFFVTAGLAESVAGQPAWAAYGGGMYSHEAEVSLHRVQFEGNAAFWGGAMYNIASNPIISDSFFYSNWARDGGAIFNHTSDPVLTGVKLMAGRAERHGAGIYNRQSSPPLTTVTLVDNEADTNGGGIFNTESAPFLTEVTLSGNRASHGAGIYNESSHITVTHSLLEGNIASTLGGGIHNSLSNPTIRDTDFEGNRAYDGAGVYNDQSSPEVTGSTFFSNTATHNGGAVATVVGSPVLSNLSIQANTAGWTGGGVDHRSGGRLTLFNASLEANTAGIGGGVYVDSSAADMANVVYVGNSATLATQGGGLFNASSAISLTNSTLVRNSAFTGGGAFINNPGGQGTFIKNTVFWNNRAGNQYPELFVNAGSGLSQTHNLISGTVGVDPSVSPFVRDPDPGGDGTWGTDDDDYGDLRPHLTSPARDTGTNAGILPDKADLDGDDDTTEAAPMDLLSGNRVYNNIVDKGAYEVQVRLRITKTVDQPSPPAGGRVTYSIVVANSGLLPANEAIINDPLPAGLQFAGPLALHPPGAGTKGSAPPTLVSDLTLAHGQQLTVTLPVTVSGRGPIENVATLTSLEVPTPVTSAVTLTGANWVPRAEDDAYRTGAGLPLRIAAPGVLGNDSDGDGDALISLYESGVSDGSLILGKDGSFTYTPTIGFVGTTSFAYRADDGLDLSPAAVVRITVEPDGYQVYLPMVLR